MEDIPFLCTSLYVIVSAVVLYIILNIFCLTYIEKCFWLLRIKQLGKIYVNDDKTISILFLLKNMLFLVSVFPSIILQ